MIIYGIDSEWDINHWNTWFSTEQAAMAWLEDNKIVKVLMIENKCSLQDFFDKGLLSIYTSKVQIK